MLIFFLMGLILVNGMGLVVGDVVFWLWVVFNLLLSCSLVIVFVVILVVIVFFKEIIFEILVRINFIFLDLIVVLFFGVVGLVVICK